MSPVHSADGRRPGHLAGGVPIHSVGRQYAHATACAALIMTHTLPRKRRRHINTICTTDIKALGDRPGITGISYFLPFVPGPTCRGSVSLYVPPLSYKREGTRRYKTSSLRHPDSQVHTSSQAQYNTQWSRVLRSGGPNHSKPLCVLVFIPIPSSRQNT
jgi:hypothetical protein